MGQNTVRDGEGRALTPQRLEDVLAALDLAGTGTDAFVAAPVPDTGLDRLFGGQLLAQALVAAARTVEPPLPAHSLHAYFLRAGDPGKEVEFHVSRLRDGRRLLSRAVTVSQEGRTLATMTASFAAPSDGLEHQAPAPPRTDPRTLPTIAQWADRWGGLSDYWFTVTPVDTRVVPDPPEDWSLVWHRAAGRLPDTALTHQAMLVYLSDITTLSAALVPHGMPLGVEHLDGRVWDGVSLDHAVWFHRPARADDWLLFAQHSPTATGGRGLVRADVFTEDGALAASIAQEGLYFDGS